MEKILRKSPDSEKYRPVFAQAWYCYPVYGEAPSIQCYISCLSIRFLSARTMVGWVERVDCVLYKCSSISYLTPRPRWYIGITLRHGFSVRGSFTHIYDCMRYRRVPEQWNYCPLRCSSNAHACCTLVNWPSTKEDATTKSQIDYLSQAHWWEKPYMQRTSGESGLSSDCSRYISNWVERNSKDTSFLPD